MTDTAASLAALRSPKPMDCDFFVTFLQYSVSSVSRDVSSKGWMNLELDDEIFVTRCLEGDQAAFTCLVSEYKEMVYAYAYHKLGDYQQAEDITQEVFIKAYRNLAQLKWPHKFRSWLYTIASNECKLWLREHSREREREVSWEDVPADKLNELAVRAHSDEDINLTVKGAMETLRDDRQLALTLFYMSGLSVREIAYFMGISPSNVKVKLHRARKQLGERLEKMIGKHLSKEKLRSGFVFKVVDAIRDMPIPSLPKPRPIRWAPIPISVGIALLVGIIGYGISSGKDVPQNMDLLKPVETTYEVSLLSDLDEQAALDIRTVGNELVALNSGDETTPEAGRSFSTGVAVQKVSVMDACGAPSPDGRYLSFVEWNSANLAVRDLTTGEDRNITDEGTWDDDMQFAEHSAWSPDSKLIAYAWWVKDGYQLRIVGLNASEPRVLYGNLPWIRPHGWSQDGKSILAHFYHDADGPMEMVLVSLADGSVRVLKSVPFEPVNTSLSPDGRYVVYDRPAEKDKEGQRDIFLLATDGSGEIPLVEHPAYDYGPIWSPDGKAIVFVSDRSGSYDAWIMPVTDGKPMGEPALAKRNMGVMRPMGFTRSGSLYYSLDAGQNNVYVAALDPATGELLSPPRKAIRRFEGFNHSPAWSPDGKYLAYVSSRRTLPSEEAMEILVIRSTETGEERELHPKWQIVTEKIRHLRWSPDGRYILPVPTRGLQMIDIQTGHVTTVVERAGIVWSSASSPDGKAIFYVCRREEGRSIMMHDLETGEGKELRWKVGHALAISPDGRQLAFIERPAGAGTSPALKVMPAAGGEPRELFRLEDPEESFHGDYSGLAWTPDGRYILFGRTKSGEPQELWRIPTEGGKPQKLLAMHKLSQINIHPDGRRIAFTGFTDGPLGTEVWVMENFLPEFTAAR